MTDHRAWRDNRTLLVVSGGLVIAAGVALAIVRFYGEVPPGQGLEAAVGAAAFGSVVAAPGLLAVLAVQDRPALVLPAALVLVPMSFLSFALVTLPLLVPAVLLARAYTRAGDPGSWREQGIAMAMVLLLVAAVLALFVHQDPREWVTPRSSYSTSDVVSYAEAAVSVLLTSTAVAVGWRWTKRPVADLPG
jgi:hypothetical protein